MIGIGLTLSEVIGLNELWQGKTRQGTKVPLQDLGDAKVRALQNTVFGEKLI